MGGGKTGSRETPIHQPAFAIYRRCILEIKKISMSPADAVMSRLPDIRCKQDGIRMHIQADDTMNSRGHGT